MLLLSSASLLEIRPWMKWQLERWGMEANMIIKNMNEDLGLRNFMGFFGMDDERKLVFLGELNFVQL